MASIVDLIANPRVANVPGAFDTGRANNLALKGSRLQNIARQDEIGRRRENDERLFREEQRKILEGRSETERQNAVGIGRLLASIETEEQLTAIKRDRRVLELLDDEDRATLENLDLDGAQEFGRQTLQLLGEGLPEQFEAVTDAQGRVVGQRNTATGQVTSDPRAAGGGALVEVFDEGSPTGTRLVPRAEAVGQPGKPASGLKVSATPGGGVEVLQGRGVTQGLQKPVVTEIQKELKAQEDQLGRVLQIQERFDPNFLTFQGRAAAFFTALKSKADQDLTPEQRDFVTRRKQFEFLVERDFNAYRRLITGAAASVQELESLKKAALNTDLPPVEFEATMGIYLSELKRGLRLRRRLLREGLDVGTGQFGDAYDGAFLGGADDDPDARAEELREQGFADEQIGDALLDEGYGDAVSF